jgi:hypothetical protein
MENRQFVAVKFRSSDARSYTYHNDGDPVACGDIVKIADRHDDGWNRATVHEISHIAPSFETKPIMGILMDEPPKDLIEGCDK